MDSLDPRADTKRLIVDILDEIEREKPRSRRADEEDDLRDYLRAQRERGTAAVPDAPAPKIEIVETILPIQTVTVQERQGDPPAPPQPPLEFTYVTALICNADGDVVSVDLMTRPT